MTDDELQATLDRLIAREDLPWDRKGSVVEVQLHGGRRQRVHFGIRNDTLRIWSRVLPSSYVRESTERWGQLALRAWRKNAHADLVGFAFDPHDRLVGFTEYPGNAPSTELLRLAVEVVAWESDRLEHLLIGMDRG